MPGYDETMRMDAMGEPPRGGTTKPYINTARLWSGGVATAVVAVLIGVVGVLVVRAVFKVAAYGSPSSGIFGDGGIIVLCVSGAVAALLATGLANLLLLGAPRPLAYLGWIIGLVTAIAVIWPFLQSGSLVVQITTALIHLVMGLAIGSLVTGAAATAGRRPDSSYDR